MQKLYTNHNTLTLLAYNAHYHLSKNISLSPQTSFTIGIYVEFLPLNNRSFPLSSRFSYSRLFSQHQEFFPINKVLLFHLFLSRPFSYQSFFQEFSFSVQFCFLPILLPSHISKFPHDFVSSLERQNDVYYVTSHGQF